MADDMKQTTQKLLEKFPEWQEKYQDYEYPRVSITIPTYNSEEKIGLTIENILKQDYPDFEIIIVDAASTDRTIEVVKNYRDDRIHIYTVSEYHRYEMLNRGITQSTGLYLNFLFPGDFYVHKLALRTMMTLALDHDSPHMVYCGTIIRFGWEDVKILYREMNHANLKKGLQPTSLESCWFHQDTFRTVGKFRRDYEIRGGFDLMCRICLKPEMRIFSIKRILTDYDLRFVTSQMVALHFYETLRTIYRYFGFVSVLQWLLIQRDIYRCIKILLRKVRTAFMGRY